MWREVRLLSYNVRSLRDDRAALARVIRATAPDVLCLQEAPRFFGWRQRTKRLARATGLRYVTGGAPACGVAVLATPQTQVERTADIPLPHQPGRHRRALSTAVLRFGNAATVGVVSCHFSLYAAERAEHRELLLQHLDTWEQLGIGASVVAGDLNEPPTGRTFQRLATRLEDGWATAPDGGAETFPARSPERRIDAVLVGGSAHVVSCGVPAGPSAPGPADLARASDHLPVLATLRIPDASPAPHLDAGLAGDMDSA